MGDWNDVILNPDDLVVSGFQGVRKVSGVISAIAREPNTTFPGESLVIILSPATILEAEDETMVGERDEFKVKWSLSKSKGAGIEYGMKSHIEKGIPIVKDEAGELIDPPIGKFVTYEKKLIRSWIDREGKPGKLDPFILAAVGKGAVEDAGLAPETVTYVQGIAVGKDLAGFKRAALLNPKTAKAGLTERVKTAPEELLAEVGMTLMKGKYLIVEA